MAREGFDWRSRALVLLGSATLLLAAFVVVASQHHDDRPEVSTPAGSACADVLVVLVPGSGEGTSTDPVNPGPTLGLFWKTLKDRLGPLRTLERHVIDYRTTSAQFLGSGRMDRPADTSITPWRVNRWEYGADKAYRDTLKLLTERQDACRYQDIILAGYAQGADVLHRVLVRLGSSSWLTRRVVGATLIADPDRARNTRAHKMGRTAAGSNAVGMRRARVTAEPDVPYATSWGRYVHVNSVCRSGDLVCDFRHQKVRTGISLHRSYDDANADQVDLAARDILIRSWAVPRPRPVTQRVEAEKGEPVHAQLGVSVHPRYTDKVTWEPRGTMPPGLSLSRSGVISGIPTSPGTWEVPYLLRNTGYPGFNRPVPATVTITVGGASSVVNSVGGDTTCTVRSNGTLWCWGDNNLGQVGIGNRVNQTRPVRVGSDRDWATVSTSGTHTCAIKKNGELWCWGENQYGQLGDFSTTSRLSPKRIGKAAGWASVHTSVFTTCAITEAGAGWCWGRNSDGQLGNGTTSSSTYPKRLSVPTGWATLSTGIYHTCGTRTDGSLWCWGANDFGQLGTGSPGSRRTDPVRIATSGYARVSAAMMNTCGVKVDGTLLCWGASSSGQLGNGTRDLTASPTPVAGTADYVDVAAGELFACGVTRDNSVNCWGDGAAGQLGRSGVTQSNRPVKVSSSANFQRVSAGWGHACALQGDGSTSCWGFSSAGQVGDGTHYTRRTPVRVLGG